MSKAPDKTSETVEFPAFDPSKTTDQLRSFAEKGIEQTREGYEKMKSGAEEAQKTMETTFEVAKSAGNDISLKLIAAMRANAEAGFSHLEALLGAKSISQVLELQTAFARKGVEMAVEQAKDIQTVSTKAAEDVAKPVRTAFEKSMKDLKAA
ncbi:phasin [Mesorhizobium xinjiangense]|uniref:phasin n=1 Tax=Mesorhizobium xinjiangense TaxID=2678685 RepID=UPI0012EDD8F6|nr:phasin [Mesorhizobium xinjiangense]